MNYELNIEDESEDIQGYDLPESVHNTKNSRKSYIHQITVSKRIAMSQNEFMLQSSLQMLGLNITE